MYYDFDWKDAPLSSHSTPVIAGCLYLLMVLLLPRCVPEGGFKLDKTLVVHNFILSFMSLVLCLGCAFEMVQRVRGESSVAWMFCENRSMSARGPLYFWSWAFYASKYYELVDTLLALLRASRPPHFGLHVYHHAFVPVLVWHWLEYCTTLQHIGLLWNTFVHVVMYAYYALKVLKALEELGNALADHSVREQHGCLRAGHVLHVGVATWRCLCWAEVISGEPGF